MKFGDRPKRVAEPLTRQDNCERRLGRDHRLPGVDLVDPGKKQVPVAADELRQRGIELLAASITRQILGRLDAAHAMRHLHVLGQPRDPARQGHFLAGELARPAFAVPLLVGGDKRVQHRLGKPRCSPSDRAICA